MAEVVGEEGRNLSRIDSPEGIRARIRSGQWVGPTSGLAAGSCQANLLVLPAAVADDFERYCRLNPGPCPLIERLAAGGTEPISAPGADLRTDLPRYRRQMVDSMEESTDARTWWRPDAVAFLLGCSFTFEEALVRAGLPLRHQEEGRNVSMYRTDRLTEPAGPFQGPLVVSMRPFPAEQVSTVAALTAPWVGAHGAPVHAGDPAGLGIADLARAEWGDPVTIRPGEVPVFWACGVTSQVAVEGAIRAGSCEWAISHAPGHMFITDLPAESALGQAACRRAR